MARYIFEDFKKHFGALPKEAKKHATGFLAVQTLLANLYKFGSASDDELRELIDITSPNLHAILTGMEKHH